MVILFYFIIMTGLIVVGALLRFWLSGNRFRKNNLVFSSDVNESVDKEVSNLLIEQTVDFIPTQVLSKRGSWRIALGQTMSVATFEEMKAEEYQKKL